MCEYCDLYDKHKGVCIRALNVLLEEVSEDTALSLMVYVVGYIIGGKAASPQAATNAVNDCYQAAVRRGWNRRTKTN